MDERLAAIFSRRSVRVYTDEPVGAGFAYADCIAGLHGALAVLAALAHRDETGKGLHIDLSEYEVVASLIGPELMQAMEGLSVLPDGNRSFGEDGAPYGCYPCLGNDCWCVIAAFDDTHWR